MDGSNVNGWQLTKSKQILASQIKKKGIEVKHKRFENRADKPEFEQFDPELKSLFAKQLSDYLDSQIEDVFIENKDTTCSQKVKEKVDVTMMMTVKLIRVLKKPQCQLTMYLHRLSNAYTLSFTSGMASCSAWGYTKENGPSTWVKSLSLEIGEKQSPINIVPSQATFDASLKDLRYVYPSFENGSLMNNGNTALFEPSIKDNVSAVTQGPVTNKYKLAQFHFHWGDNIDSGSEHTVDGERYAGELHLVHWNTDLYDSPKAALTSQNGLVVFGIFLKVGDKGHSGLNIITSKLPEVTKSGSKVVLTESFNPSCLFPDSSEYWSYPGSLTTPPLSESVTWVVFKKPIVVSKEQMAAFRELESSEGDKLCQNCRPVCPVLKREVKASFKY